MKNYDKNKGLLYIQYWDVNNLLVRQIHKNIQ